MAQHAQLRINVTRYNEVLALQLELCLPRLLVVSRI